MTLCEETRLYIAPDGKETFADETFSYRNITRNITFSTVVCQQRGRRYRLFLMNRKPRLRNASSLARVKCRGCARTRFAQVMESSTGLTLERVATAIIVRNVCARISGTGLTPDSFQSINAASKT
jgi:hypothetical protein